MDPVLVNEFGHLGLGGLALLTLVVVHAWTVKVTIPKMLDTFREELRLEREICAARDVVLAKRMEGVENGLIGLRQTLARSIPEGK